MRALTNCYWPRIWSRILRISLVPVVKPKIKGYEGVEGFLKPLEAVMLFRIAQRLSPNSTIVEIGSWKGKSTCCLAKGLKSGKIIAIDPFDAAGEEASRSIYAQDAGMTPLLQQFRSNMTALGLMGKIDVWQGYSQDFVGKPSRIDLLFIDGDHSISGCDFDYTHFASALVPGGYLLFHDYYFARKDLGPTWVVENRVLPSKEYRTIGLFDSLWVSQRRTETPISSKVTSQD